MPCTLRVKLWPNTGRNVVKPITDLPESATCRTGGIYCTVSYSFPSRVLFPSHKSTNHHHCPDQEAPLLPPRQGQESSLFHLVSLQIQLLRRFKKKYPRLTLTQCSAIGALSKVITNAVYVVHPTQFFFFTLGHDPHRQLESRLGHDSIHSHSRCIRRFNILTLVYSIDFW